MNAIVVSVVVGGVLLLVLQVAGLAWYWSLLIAFVAMTAVRILYQRFMRRG